jgi:hypothetical protein
MPKIIRSVFELNFVLLDFMQSTKKISFIIKVLIIAITFWFLYQKVFASESFSDITVWFLNVFDTKSSMPLVLVVVLMIINWSLEAIKWRYLIQKLQKISFFLALKAVFLGVTVSIFTPNRIGEFGGRVFCLNHDNRIKGVLLTILGNFSQLLATMIFGLLASVYFVYTYADLMPIDSDFLFYVLSIVFIAACLFFIYCFLNSSILTVFFKRFKFLRKYEEYLDVFSYFSKTELMKVLFFSIFRFLVFTTQFYILIQFFIDDLTYLQSATMSSLTFLSMSIIPTIALTEIGVRGSVAVYFFGLFSANSLGIMTAAFSLWAVNLVIPAIIGLFFVFSLKFFRS